jgi:methionyl-tRNA synthetase
MATAPEARETELSWEDFVEPQGQQRAGGNLGQSVPTPVGTRVGCRSPTNGSTGWCPNRGTLRAPQGRAWMTGTGRSWRRSRPDSKPSRALQRLQVPRGPGEALALAREANGYTFTALPSASLRTRSACLDRNAPWFQIKEDKAAAATSVYVTRSVRAVDNLKTILAPTLCVPHTAQGLHEYLGYDGQLRCPCTGHAAGGRVPGGDPQPRGADV